MWQRTTSLSMPSISTSITKRQVGWTTRASLSRIGNLRLLIGTRERKNKMASEWDKLTIEELNRRAEGFQEQLMEAEKELAETESPSRAHTLALRKKNNARDALEELLGYTKRGGEFVIDATAPDGTPVGHWTEGVFVKGVIQKRLEEPQRLLEESNLGERFRGRTFASFDAKKDKEAFDICSKYANDEKLMLRKRNGLLIAGGYGSGKTHLAAAVSKALTDRGIGVLFGTFIEHLEHIKEDFDNTGINRHLARMKSIPVLVIDDLGKEKKSDWTKQTLFDVLNFRYEHQLPTIITTNLVNGDDFSALANHVEGAVWSRICEMCNNVITKGSDYRKGER